MVDFDAIFEKTGELGRYQLFMLFLLCFPTCFLNSYCGFGWVFMFYTPEHHCHVSPQLLANYSQAGFRLDVGQCSIKLHKNDSLVQQEVTNEIPCPQGWDYDRSQFKESIISRWDLVCDQAIIPKTILAVAGIVTIFGCIFLSWAQDRFGREACFYMCVLVFITGNFISLFMPTLVGFAIFRCLSAFVAISSWNVGYIWAIELVGPSKRTFISTALCVIYAGAAVSLAGLAYIFNTWLQFGLVTTAPFLLLLPFHWLVVESPRWQVSVGKFDQAKASLGKIIRRNGHKIEEKELDALMTIGKREQAKIKRKKNTVFDLFRGPQLRYKTILITIVWVGNALVYFAIAYNVENISDNFYIMYSLQAAMEAPATMINLLILNRVGRILPMFTGMVVGGICCLLTAVSAFPDWLIILLALIGKFGICVSYITIYQVASELFPTVVRGLGNGLCSVFGEGANVLMPYVVHTAVYHRSLPMIILGSLAIIGGSTSLFLPETLGLHMAETLEEGETHGHVGLPALRSHIARVKRGVAILCGRGGGKNADSNGTREEIRNGVNVNDGLLKNGLTAYAYAAC